MARGVDGRVAPVIAELAGRRPEQTIFTRFIPPATPEDAQGAWRDYYRKWDNMTRARMPAEMIDLIEPLNRSFRPPKCWISPSILRGLMDSCIAISPAMACAGW